MRERSCCGFPWPWLTTLETLRCLDEIGRLRAALTLIRDGDDGVQPDDEETHAIACRALEGS